MTAYDYTINYNNGLTVVTETKTVEPGSTITGTITAGQGYKITEFSGAYYRARFRAVDVKDFVATKVSDYKYNYSFTAPSYKIDITLNVSTTPAPAEPTSIDIDTKNLVNCSVTPATIPQGTQTVLTLNADKGYTLEGTGTYIVDGTTNTFTCDKVASYQISVTANTSVSISFTATKAETDTKSIVHTYVLSQDNYNVLGKQIIAGVNSTGTGFDQYDYTKFISYLYQIPFHIGNDITNSSSTINLGKQNLTVDCLTVTQENLNIDLGTIDLTNVSSSHDLQPISTTLYCPFSSNIVLPPTVLGSKLYLSFSINLKTEQALLLIKQNDNIIYSGQTELFTDLPLYYSAGNKDSLVKQLRAQYQNAIKRAYVVVSYHKAITDLSSYKTTEHGVLSSYKGFTRVSNGTLKKSVSSSIDSALLSLLKHGVIIK